MPTKLKTQKLKGEFFTFKDNFQDAGHSIRRHMAIQWVQHGKAWDQKSKRFVKTITGNTAEATKAVVKVKDGKISYFCPGCKKDHVIPLLNGSKPARFTWNGDKQRPTISPDVFSVEPTYCRHYVQDGRIQYLSDTAHSYSGSTVPMQTREDA